MLSKLAVLRFRTISDDLLARCVPTPPVLLPGTGPSGCFVSASSSCEVWSLFGSIWPECCTIKNEIGLSYCPPGITIGRRATDIATEMRSNASKSDCQKLLTRVVPCPPSLGCSSSARPNQNLTALWPSWSDPFSPQNPPRRLCHLSGENMGLRQLPDPGLAGSFSTMELPSMHTSISRCKELWKQYRGEKSGNLSLMERDARRLVAICCMILNLGLVSKSSYLVSFRGGSDRRVRGGLA